MIVNKMPSKTEWIDTFVKSNKYQTLLEKANSYKIEPILLFDELNVNNQTRPFTTRENDIRAGIFDLQPFYILDYISQHTQESIYDIGCGFNFFKNFYNIVGIDPDSKYADIKDAFDDDFCSRYYNKLPNVFSINAIHFTSFDNLEIRIKKYFDLISSGYAYLAINLSRVYEKTFNKELKDKKQFAEVFDKIKTIKKIISNIEGEILMLEDSFIKNPDSGMNGNIRVLIKR